MQIESFFPTNRCSSGQKNPAICHFAILLSDRPVHRIAINRNTFMYVLITFPLKTAIKYSLLWLKWNTLVNWAVSFWNFFRWWQISVKYYIGWSYGMKLWYGARYTTKFRNYCFSSSIPKTIEQADTQIETSTYAHKRTHMATRMNHDLQKHMKIPWTSETTNLHLKRR